MKSSYRQNLILNFIREKTAASNKEIKTSLTAKIGKLDRVTIIRDIEKMMNQGLIVKIGKGRSVKYKSKDENKLLAFFDKEDYFKESPDQRNIQGARFNFDIFKYFSKEIFSKEELNKIDKLNDNYIKRIKTISPTILKKEFERLAIELSWKSSQIEGNTYSLIDTEILIKENKLAKNHTKEEAQMILNHKKTLDYIVDNKSIFKNITLSKIENTHKLIIGKMGVQKNIREGLVGITGTTYKPLDNQYQIKKALEKMILLIGEKNMHPLAKSLATILLISYIQPFEDGNKRTARLLGNAILLAHNYCPLSYRSIDENDYKKATLLFYEQNSALLFKNLFLEQFIFSINNYFLVKLPQ